MNPRDLDPPTADTGRSERGRSSIESPPTAHADPVSLRLGTASPPRHADRLIAGGEQTASTAAEETTDHREALHGAPLREVVSNGGAATQFAPFGANSRADSSIVGVEVHAHAQHPGAEEPSAKRRVASLTSAQVGSPGTSLAMGASSRIVAPTSSHETVATPRRGKVSMDELRKGLAHDWIAWLIGLALTLVVLLTTYLLRQAL